MTRSEFPRSLLAVIDTLRDLRAPWAITGGWAIDLALSHVTRSHADVDVAVFRDAQDALHAALPTWELSAVVDGTLRPWPRGVSLTLPTHEVHARPPAGTPGSALEFLLNERDETDWVYRRDPMVRLPLARAVRASALGPPVLAPEIVLLYKSKAPRPADEHDFRVAQPLLDAAERAWLAAALRRATPDHPWAAALAAA